MIVTSIPDNKTLEVNSISDLKEKFGLHGIHIDVKNLIERDVKVIFIWKPVYLLNDGIDIAFGSEDYKSSMYNYLMSK